MQPSAVVVHEASVLLLPLLLQVVDIASGQPLLPTDLPGCGGTLLWWGDSSNTLAYSYTVGCGGVDCVCLWERAGGGGTAGGSLTPVICTVQSSATTACGIATQWQ